MAALCLLPSALCPRPSPPSPRRNPPDRQPGDEERARPEPERLRLRRAAAREAVDTRQGDQRGEAVEEMEALRRTVAEQVADPAKQSLHDDQPLTDHQRPG